MSLPRQVEFALLNSTGMPDTDATIVMDAVPGPSLYLLFSQGLAEEGARQLFPLALPGPPRWRNNPARECR